ncbi:DUF2637 domain-containing protein [Nocardia mangyaensis]|uniref:DUF2637 domain-containing protein n=1 Tax=Nocardia mangyaensis TaxID=2213200 RepID=UPI00267711BF|nr:DUF2637 domain-containing protein [Nocardia mangyaensis]MDO3646173.1 DUF2637 domain-containing protein [Nocardia mangyaensis]
MDHTDPFSRPVPVSVPKLLVGLGSALAVAAAIASFTFTSTLARAAGIPEHLTWLWPVVVGLTVALIACTFITLVGIRDEKVTSLVRFYELLLIAAVLASICGNVLAISRDPMQLGILEIATVVSVPPLCLMICVGNYLLLTAVVPVRIVAAIREDDWRLRVLGIPGAPSSQKDPNPAHDDGSSWWDQHRSEARTPAAPPTPTAPRPRR